MTDPLSDRCASYLSARAAHRPSALIAAANREATTADLRAWRQSKRRPLLAKLLRIFGRRSDKP